MQEDSFFTEHYKSRGRVLFPEASISFSFQEVPDGTARAVLAAKDFTAGGRFIVLNGDNNYPVESVLVLRSSPEEHCTMVAYDIEGFNEETRDRVKSYAAIRTGNGRLVDIVEKPDDPGRYKTSDLLYSDGPKRVKVENKRLVSMNLWWFDRDIIEACMTVPRHEPRKSGKPGEYELPDAVKLLIDGGRELLVYYACADVLDLTKAEDLDTVRRRIEEDLKDRIEDLESRYSRL